MQRFIARLAIAIHTFTLGTILVGPWPAYESGVTRGNSPIPPSAPRKAYSLAAREGWQKIEGVKFFLYAPPDMREDRYFFDDKDFDGAIEDAGFYSGGELHFWYICSGRRHCEPHPVMGAQLNSEIKISGRPAKIYDLPGTFLMDLCVPDIGDGKTSLWLRAGGKDQRALVVAKGVFASIELK